MATAASGLTEPEVLAHTKRRLFPDEGTNSYAVVDTQFATDTWLAETPIDPEIRDVLAPFNHVRVGSGYPDVVGVCHLGDDFLSVERLGDQPPLVAVEAKGHTGRGVDATTGVVQAHDRLHEANVAFLAAPLKAISGSARSLARELNVGVLGVSESGAVEVLEIPRVVGNRTTTETTAIRLQASAQGVADASFGLNHPKNYLAYPLAVYHPGETEKLVAERVVGAVDSARKGATFLGLVESGVAGDELTPLGREVVRFGFDECGSVEAALKHFRSWKRSRERFISVAPRWGRLARRVVFAYPATQLLLEELRHLHEDGLAEPTLVEFVDYLHALHPSFAVELFVRSDDARSRVLTTDGDLVVEELRDGTVYHSPTVFQLKAMLYHAGVLTERGREPSKLDPTTDVWALRHPVVDR